MATAEYASSASASDDDRGGCAGCGDSDVESHNGFLKDGNSYIRRDFIRKVYSILTAQLMLTVCIAAPFNLFLTPEWVSANIGWYYLTLGITMCTICSMTCCGQAVQTFPTNFMLLTLITVCMSVMVGFVTVLYTTTSVLFGVLITCFIFFALTAYACCTKTDFTGMGPYLYAALLCLLGFSLLLTTSNFLLPMFGFTGEIPGWIQTAYAAAGALLFSFYIIYDTQLIVGGAHKSHSFGVDDYVFAALTLYLDIINLFLHILSLFGERR